MFITIALSISHWSFPAVPSCYNTCLIHYHHPTCLIHYHHPPVLYIIITLPVLYIIITLPVLYIIITHDHLHFTVYNYCPINLSFCICPASTDCLYLKLAYFECSFYILSVQFLISLCIYTILVTFFCSTLLLFIYLLFV